MQETYLLTQGPRWESLFNTGAFQGFGGSKAGGVMAGLAWITDRTKGQRNYLLIKEDEEEDKVEQRLSVLEKAQERFHWDLEEVIWVIPDRVWGSHYPQCITTASKGGGALHLPSTLTGLLASTGSSRKRIV
ncbi:UNVERIFIED_CONTAM: hypothetical protein K2H54_021752 [Gekko kuhli]